MFSPEEVLARLRQQPFEPLRVLTDSGEHFDITYPKLVLVGRTALIIGVASAANPTIFETTKFVSLLHVIDLQTLPASKA